uniref:Arginine vasopressin-induced protein 1 n=1 Tax=Salarias fasciatus TaxID=181472 RepID=A0A672IIZ1_SALFA
NKALLKMDALYFSTKLSKVLFIPELLFIASRKTGSGNIFSNVNLWQLQRLFRAAGDEDAEQRAQLVWGHRDEAELAQALIGLRARSHRRGLRANGKDALGSHWLRAFNHLR